MPETNVPVRPEHLPDFKLPPLNEVVIGLQFSTPQGYQQIRAGEVWSLFSQEYPNVQEQPALEPTFETFGGPFQHAPRPSFSFITGCTHDRFWFLSQDGAELIQFQQDRLLHNWRKIGDKTNDYPRFESMVSKFSTELNKLEQFVSSLAPQRLAINQCEVSYINHIPLDRGAGERLSDWLRFVNFAHDDPDDFSMSIRSVIRDASGKPLGRFIAESALGFLPDGQQIIVLTLTVKGAPLGTDIDSGLKFLALGREEIVRRFADLTTDQAHQKWERIN